MFECERCGSSYSASHLGVEHCPRCRLRDRVQAPLAFRAFRLPLAQSESRLRGKQPPADAPPVPETPAPGG